jgi:hypothetical protein
MNPTYETPDESISSRSDNHQDIVVNDYLVPVVQDGDQYDALPSATGAYEIPQKSEDQYDNMSPANDMYATIKELNNVGHYALASDAAAKPQDIGRNLGQYSLASEGAAKPQDIASDFDM